MKQRVLQSEWWEDYKEVFQPALTTFRAMTQKIRELLPDAKRREFDLMRRKFRDGKASPAQVVAWVERNAERSPKEAGNLAREVFTAIAADDMFHDPGIPEPFVEWVRTRVPGQEHAFEKAVGAVGEARAAVVAGVDVRAQCRVMPPPSWWPANHAYCVVVGLGELEAVGLCEKSSCSDRHSSSRDEDTTWLCDAVWRTFNGLDKRQKAVIQECFDSVVEQWQRGPLTQEKLLAHVVPFWVTKDPHQALAVASAHIQRALAGSEEPIRKAEEVAERARRASGKESRELLSEAAQLRREATKTMRKAEAEAGDIAVLRILLDDLAYIWHFDDKRSSSTGGTIMVLWPGCPQAYPDAMEFITSPEQLVRAGRA
jgi:hypothetical protein